MEKIIIIGNATKAPQRFTSQAGNTYVMFSVAVNKTVNHEKLTDFFDVLVYGKQGDSVLQYVGKGNKVSVLGDLSVRTYTTNAGETRVAMTVNNAQVEFLSSPTAQTEYKENKPDMSDKPDMSGWQTLKPDDIPF